MRMQNAGDPKPGESSRHRNSRGRSRSLQEFRVALRARLEARRPDIEQAIRTRVYAISDPFEVRDPEYIEGLGTALTVALDHGLTVVELGEERAPAIPTALLAQARMAARDSVAVDTVLRRYCAGYSVLSEFVIEEAEDSGLLRGTTLKCILRDQAVGSRPNSRVNSP